MDRIIIQRGNELICGNNPIPDGEICVTESGTYVYKDNKFTPFPQFCSTCVHNDTGKCAVLYDAYGVELSVNDKFYCGFHKMKEY